MTGLEVFVNAPYAKMVRLYERETNQSLVYGYDWELGKLLVPLIVKVVVSKNLYFLFVQVSRYCSVPDVSINK